MLRGRCRPDERLLGGALSFCGTSARLRLRLADASTHAGNYARISNARTPNIRKTLNRLSTCYFHSTAALYSEHDDDDKKDKEKPEVEKERKQDDKESKKEPLTPFDEAAEIEGFEDTTEEEDDNGEDGEEIPSLDEKVSLNEEDLNPLICEYFCKISRFLLTILS